MQLAFDSADRLVELVEERRGRRCRSRRRRVGCSRSQHLPAGLARDACSTTSSKATRASRGAAARSGSPRRRRGTCCSSRRRTSSSTSRRRGSRRGGRGSARSAPCASRALELDGELETLVDPGGPLPAAIGALTGLRDAELRGAPPPARPCAASSRSPATRCSSPTTRASTSPSSTARSARLTGRRLAAPVVDTVGLARRLLAGRTTRCGLAALAQFFGTSATPCHRALPDAQATAEILLALLGLAQERGRAHGRGRLRARGAAAAPRLREALARPRRAAAARRLPLPRRARPSCSTSAGRATCARGCARTSARERQRPAVEAALGAVERIEWRVLGSELEAALEELRLIRRAASARERPRSSAPRRLPPPPRDELGRERAARRAEAGRRCGARAAAVAEPGAARGAGARGARLARGGARGGAGPRAAVRPGAALRGRGAAPRPDRGARGRAAAGTDVRAAAATSAVLLVPAAQDGFTRAFFVRGGRVAAVRTLPPGAGARLELEAGVAETTRAELPPEDADELLLVASSCAARRRSSASSRSRRWCGPPPDRAFTLAPMAQELQAVATATFADRLAEAVERKRSQLVVGLDPRLELLPVELRGSDPDSEPAGDLALLPRPRRRRRAVRRRGEAAARVLRGARRRGHARASRTSAGTRATAGLLVIADGKRGDIGSTARAYAAAYLESGHAADALTVNPYLGRDSLEPFLHACRRTGAGLFCLVKTSNPGGADVQDLTLSDGRPLWQHVAALVDEWGEELVGEHGLSSVGAVVGATHPRAVGEARRLMPQSILLLPGRRRAGRDAGRRRAGVHERAGERARDRLALGDLRVPGRGRRLAPRRGRRGGAARARGLGRRRAGRVRRGAGRAARRSGRVPARGDGRSSCSSAPPTADDEPATAPPPATTGARPRPRRPPRTRRRPRRRPLRRAGSTYTIEAGDTLQTIADQYGTTVERAARAEPGSRPDGSPIGQRIRSPARIDARLRAT